MVLHTTTHYKVLHENPRGTHNVPVLHGVVTFEAFGFEISRNLYIHDIYFISQFRQKSNNDGCWDQKRNT